MSVISQTYSLIINWGISAPGMGKKWLMDLMLLVSDITDIRYSAEAHLYCSAQPSVFYHIVLNNVINTCLFLRNDINRLLCAVVVSAFCFLSSDKKE